MSATRPLSKPLDKDCIRLMVAVTGASASASARWACAAATPAGSTKCSAAWLLFVSALLLVRWQRRHARAPSKISISVSVTHAATTATRQKGIGVPRDIGAHRLIRLLRLERCRTEGNLEEVRAVCVWEKRVVLCALASGKAACGYTNTTSTGQFPETPTILSRTLLTRVSKRKPPYPRQRQPALCA